MFRTLALATLLLVAGCTTSAAHTASTRVASSAPSASPSVALVTPTPTSAPSDLPLSTVGFSCRLPVMTLTYGPETMTYQGGFISFPSGMYAADANGTINFQSGSFVTKQAPVLTGGGPDQLSPPFFDAGAGRWVPSSAGESAPDGSSYAYATVSDPSTRAAAIHLVDVRRGNEKTYRVAIPVASGTGIQVLDDDGAGVYFGVGQIDQQYPAGVWRLDLLTGSVTEMAQVANVIAVRDGYAWAETLDVHDPTPPQVGGLQQFDTIYEVNLVSHIPTSWYYTPGRSDYLLGFASGDRPIVSVSSAPDFSWQNGEVRIIDHPNTSGGEDNGELVSAPGLSLASPQADGDRTWFGGAGGIYLYTPGAGLQRVFAGGGNAKSPEGMISPAGICR